MFEWIELLGWTTFLIAAAGLWFLGLFKKAGEKFAEEFGKFFGQKAGEWLRDRRAPFKYRYRDHLREMARHVDLKAFAQDSPFALDLIDVFVDLSLDPESARKIKAGIVSRLPEKLQEGRHSVWEYLEEKGRRIAVIGPPGCGKTTLLKHVILEASHARWFRGRKAARALPVFIEIRKHAKAIGENGRYRLADAVRDQLGSFGNKASPSWFDSRLDQGGCLVLMDGMDEVADANLRRKVADWVAEQVAAYPKNRYLVTSRPAGYKSNPIDGFNTLEVRSFTPADIERFVQAWYLANEIGHHHGRKDHAVREKAKEGAGGLLAKLRTSRNLGDLAPNPLLLTMIATVHRYRGSLPGSRVELYADICSVFLGRRQESKGIESSLRPDQKQSVLEPLAYAMMLRRAKEIETTDACQFLEEPLAAVRPGLAAVDFLRDIESGSGLFVERENGVWGFAHLTIQEYLSAVHIQRQGLSGQLASHVDDSWWHETARLYVAQADATPIVAACLDQNPPVMASLVLAIQCLGEAKKIDPAQRREFEESIARCVESDNPEERRPVSEALLHLRLAEMVALDENRFLSGYITNAEYQLFVDELREQGEYRQPDHWLTDRFPPGVGNRPVAGVRASDAEAFAKWLSGREQDGYTFRVPRPGEEAPELEGDAAGFWVQSPEGDWKIASASALAIATENKELFEAGDRALDLARAFDLARALDLARDFALSLALARDRALALALDLGRAPDLALALARNRALALARALDRALARDLALDLDRALDRDLALDRALQQAAAWLKDRGRRDLLARLDGKHEMSLVLPFLARYARYSSILLAWAAQSALTRGDEGKQALEQLRDHCLDIYTICTLHQLRLEGKIPILGGIRVVKERIDAGARAGKNSTPLPNLGRAAQSGR